MIRLLRSVFDCQFSRLNYLSCRMFTTTDSLSKGYEQWPHKKFRRIGRGPNAMRGQGGKKSRIAYDKRYPLSGKDINESTEGLKRGGNIVMGRMIGEESKLILR